jgi:hypothetical protein
LLKFLGYWQTVRLTALFGFYFGWQLKKEIRLYWLIPERKLAFPGSHRSQDRLLGAYVQPVDPRLRQRQD